MSLTYGLMRIVFGTAAFLWLLSFQPLINILHNVGAWSWASPLLVEIIWWVGLAGSVLVIAGLGLRAATILQALSLSLLFFTPVRFGDYGDRLLVILSILMILLPSRDPLSLDARFFGGRQDFSPWLRRTLMLVLGLIYLSSMIVRLRGEHWWGGTAAWIAMADAVNSRVGKWMARDPEAFPRLGSYIMTYLALAYESLFPFLIWVKALRVPLVIAGLVYHIGMGLVLDQGLYPLLMVVLLLACLDGQQIRESAASDRGGLVLSKPVK